MDRADSAQALSQHEYTHTRTHTHTCRWRSLEASCEKSRTKTRGNLEMPPPLPLQLEFLSTTFAANGKRNGVESVIVGVERGVWQQQLPAFTIYFRCADRQRVVCAMCILMRRLSCKISFHLCHMGQNNYNCKLSCVYTYVA